MTCAQGLLRLLWGGGRSWSATGLQYANVVFDNELTNAFIGDDGMFNVVQL